MTGNNKRFLLRIAYDGRPYDGWQSQPGGNTIQDNLLAVLQKICPDISTVQGSGRTDAGVSADAQTAHFDVPESWKMDHIAWQKALNAQLPRSIRIMDCQWAAPEFHARFSTTGKTYRYRIFRGDVLPPLELGLAWHRRNLDFARFMDEIKIFEGTHHFRAFSANRHDGKDETRDTQRTIHAITSRSSGKDMLEVEITGDGFLYKMVRFLIGTAAFLTEEKLSPETVENWLNTPPDDEKAPYCAPPDGLSLKEVYYEKLNLELF